MTTTLIERTDFLTVPSSDVPAALAFYRDTLGLRCSVDIPERGYAEVETGNLTLSLVDTAKMGMDFAPNRNPVALHVADVAAAREALEARGVTFGADTFDTGVCHMAMFADPDGNALMLHSRYAPPSPAPDAA